MSTLDLTARETAAGFVLEVRGDLDYDSAASVRERVAGLAPHLHAGLELVLDLSRMDFCDSTGMTALLAARQCAQEAGAGLVLAGVPARTLRILAIAGLDRVFTLRPAAPSR